MRIFLIGYMASGKSTVGPMLANELGIAFIDLDVAIESHAAQSIPEIFSSHGENYFRNLESQVLRSIINQSDQFVVATGGGTPCFGDNLNAMLTHGTVVYLKCDAATIEQRLLASEAQRPLTTKDDFDLRVHLNSRLSAYEQAHIMVDASAQIDAVVESIITQLR
jgi:shikimate kinase